MGVGVAIRPVVRFFDKTGRRIRPTPFRWISEDTNVAMVDDDLMLINSFFAGTTAIYAETNDGKLLSNGVPLEVVNVQEVWIEPHTVELSAGSRGQLTARCILATGGEARDVALIWTENNPTIARVSATGLVFGAAPGQTEVWAGDDNSELRQSAVVTVVDADDAVPGEGKGGGKGTGRNRGRGYPVILVSGEVDPDPETDQYVHFPPDDPPVQQRPKDVDRNIWWVNSASPLARMYLKKELGYGYESREWRMYHVERYIDIISRIAMMYDPHIKGPITVNEWVLYAGSKAAEIQAAMAEQLGAFIKEGELPQAN